MITLLPAVLALLLAASEPASGSLSVSDRFAPGDQRTWVFEQGGARIGEHGFRYDGPVELLGVAAHRFTGWTRLAAGGLPEPMRIQVEHVVDDGGHPLRSRLLVALGEAVSGVDVVFGDGRATASVNHGGQPRDVIVDVPGNMWSQANNVLGGFDLLFALNPVGEDDTLEVSMFSSNMLRVFPYRAVWSAQGDAGGVVLTDSLGETLTLDAEGHLLKLEVPSAGLVVSLSDEQPEWFDLAPPEPPTRMADLDAEDVEVRHGETLLSGTLTRPRGVEGPLPGVVFLSGSGPQDRDGFSNGIDVGTHEILDRISEDGLCVLRVDDRNVGRSTGPQHKGLTGLLADATACVDFLLAREDVDPARVAIIGHSEGGTTAPLVARARPQVAAVVLMAAIARPLPEVMLEQNAAALAGTGLSAEEQATALAQVRAGFARLASDEELTADDLGPEFVPLLVERRWFREHARHDPLATLRTLRCPVLVLQGGKDFQVSPERDAELLDATLDAAGQAEHELIVFPQLDHLFKRTPGDVSSLADYLRPRPVDEQFLATLSAWLRGALGESD